MCVTTADTNQSNARDVEMKCENKVNNANERTEKKNGTIFSAVKIQIVYDGIFFSSLTLFFKQSILL